MQIENYLRNSQKNPTSPKNARKIHISSKNHAEASKNIKTAKIKPEMLQEIRPESKNKKKNCTINFFPPAIFLHKKQTGEYFVWVFF